MGCNVDDSCDDVSCIVDSVDSSTDGWFDGIDAVVDGVTVEGSSENVIDGLRVGTSDGSVVFGNDDDGYKDDCNDGCIIGSMDIDSVVDK